MDFPFVSCLCPTYGRGGTPYQILPEEALESFLRQDYPADRRELVILNDHPKQTILCQALGVRVVNLPYRCKSLGGKRNLLTALAHGSVLLPYDDDDLALPHYLGQAVSHLAHFGYWNPRAAWYHEAGREPVYDRRGLCHNASAYTRVAWLKAGCYPPISGPEDMAFDAALRRAVGVAPPLPDGEAPGRVYRWAVSDCHISGNADHEKAYRERAAVPVPAGEFVLAPRWRRDYAAELAGHPGITWKTYLSAS